MSLYKARDWWATTCGNEEEYEARSLVIGTIDDNSSKQSIATTVAVSQSSLCRASWLLFKQERKLDTDLWGADTIITGSLQGILRIYQPRQQGFSIEDLLLETQLQAPILQLDLGTFTA